VEVIKIVPLNCCSRCFTKRITEIVTASTGNAACSLACLGASAGLKVVIFAPQSAPPAKLIQIQVHNAELHKVDGSLR
jgi:threonine synthase